MTSDEQRYVPAAGRARSRAPTTSCSLRRVREPRWRPCLADAVLRDLPSTGVIADVGSGTGTLAIALAARRPDLRIIAVDGDPAIQALAQRKPGAHLVQWRHGLADDLALPDSSVDRVVMSLLLHHLEPAAKRRALHEARRILVAGGQLHVADWGRPGDPIMRTAFFALQLIDGFANTRDHAAGRLPDFLTDSGLTAVTSHRRIRTAWGRLELLSATRP